MQGSLLVNNLRKIISLIDNLRDLGLEQLIKLPKVVVLGSQSSGKSSLLQQIVGIDFLPRGSGVVTRRPLELRLTYDATLKQPFAKFQQLSGSTFTNFNQVRDKINFLTDKLCGTEKIIINKPIILNISSPSCPNITIVDLPGITSIPVGKQPDNIYEITKQMALSYIKEQRSIILCVIPANQDLSTSQALKIMRQIDPRGSRSLGCLTKIDIMDRGTNAKNILTNQEIPLKYGYVGIKNRSQQDINQNKPVSYSLQQQKKFFAGSPIYSSLPAGCCGTQALTQKITKILYTQIKDSMPSIVAEIGTKTKECKEKLDRLGPGVAKTPQELIDYVWKMIAKFLKIFKNSLEGIRDPDYNQEPFGPKIRKLMNEFYKDHYDDAATENLKDSDIQQAMYNFPGESIPGFPSIDAFLALLNPLLAKLKQPAFALIDQIYNILQKQAGSVIDKVMIKKYPIFNQKFNETVSKVFETSRYQAKMAIQELLDAQLDYLYTNDLSYLMGDFKVSQDQKKKVKKNFDPLVFELRKRIDAYHHLVVRNLRDLIPTQDENNYSLNLTILLEIIKNCKNEIKQERQKTEKAMATLQAAEKRIKRDPQFGKMVKGIISKQDEIYEKFDIKRPERQVTPQKVIYKPGKTPPKTRPNEDPKNRPSDTPRRPEIFPQNGTLPPKQPVKTVSDNSRNVNNQTGNTTNTQNPNNTNNNFNAFNNPVNKQPVVNQNNVNNNNPVNNNVNNFNNTTNTNNGNTGNNANKGPLTPPPNNTPKPNFDFLGLGTTQPTVQTSNTPPNNANKTNNPVANNTVNNNPVNNNPLPGVKKTETLDTIGVVSNKPTTTTNPNLPVTNTTQPPKDQKKSLVNNLFGFGPKKP